MATTLQIGDRIQNRWQIYKILRGGMGVVYIVYDHESREPFAAKTFQDELFARSPVVAERFRQEALTWINLDAHQNIAKARFVQIIAGKPYLFLEYVGGGDLSSWIGTPRLTQDLPQVLRFAIQFCDGMSHALAKDISAHRDIKPQNCLITPDYTLKVTDFGLAKVFDDAEPSDLEAAQSPGVGLTRTGTAAGTCTHMAPEQFDDAKHVDVRADIYSFGVMLYQMLTGRLPFAGETLQEFERLHKTQPPPALGAEFSAIGTIVHTCLAKAPADRFADFGVARKQLAGIYEGLTGAPAPQPVTGAELDANDLNNKGANLAELERYQEALACYDSAQESNPHSEVTWANRGSALHSLGRMEEALDCYDRAIESAPRFAGAWFNKGATLYVSGRRQEALDCYDSSIEFNPRYENAWNAKGVVLDDLGRYEEALACYDQALQLNPMFSEAWNSKVVPLGSLGRHDEALVCVDRALEINPRNKHAWYNKALVLGQGYQRYGEALECAEEAQRLGYQQAAKLIAQLRQLRQLFQVLGQQY